MTTAWPFDNATMDSIRKVFEKVTIENEMSSEAFWESLSYEDKCDAFQAVVSRIYKGELLDKKSYRAMLYDIFGFKEDMYARAIDCGYLALHNSIDQDFEEHKKIVENFGENID